MLIRLRGCPGWSASLLFAYGIRHVFAWPGPILMCIDPYSEPRATPSNSTTPFLLCCGQIISKPYRFSLETHICTPNLSQNLNKTCLKNTHPRSKCLFALPCYKSGYSPALSELRNTCTCTALEASFYCKENQVENTDTTLILSYTVQPVYKNHHGNMENWTLFTDGLLFRVVSFSDSLHESMPVS